MLSYGARKFENYDLFVNGVWGSAIMNPKLNLFGKIALTILLVLVYHLFIAIDIIAWIICGLFGTLFIKIFTKKECKEEAKDR